MTIRAEVDRFDRERCRNFLHNQLVVNIIEDDLTIEADRAHEQLIERTEAEALNMTRMLVELSYKLLGRHVVKAHGAMIRDGTDDFLL